MSVYWYHCEIYIKNVCLATLFTFAGIPVDHYWRRLVIIYEWNYDVLLLMTVIYRHLWPNLRPWGHFSSSTWWRHQMETFSALLAICAGNSPASGEFPAQRPVTRSFDAFFDLCLNKRLRKQSWGCWFETLSCPLWRHCNADLMTYVCFGWIDPYYSDDGPLLI